MHRSPLALVCVLLAGLSPACASGGGDAMGNDATTDGGSEASSEPSSTTSAIQ